MAASAYFDAVQKLYIAYYGRPADTVGLNYWAEQIDAKKGDIQAVVNAFGTSAEAQAIYGSVDTVVQVNNLFKNILGRDADVDGLNFYASNVASGKYTLASLAQRILDGATTGDDAKVVANKLAAAKAFTGVIDTTTEIVAYTGDASAQQAREFLKAVTADTATVPDATKAQAVVTGLAGAQTPEQTFQLTNGADKKTANVFEAAQVYTPGGNDRINSLQNDDVLTGTGANPTLNAVLGNTGDNGATVITPTLKAIETINARFDATNASMTLDLQDASGVKAVNVTRVAEDRNATVQNIADKVEKLSVANSQSPENNITFTFLGDAVKGKADAVELKLSNVNTKTLTVEERGTAAEGFETINLVSTGAANKVATLQAEDLQTLNISGDKDLTLGGVSASFESANVSNVESTRYATSLSNVAGSLNKIDAKDFTGKLDITLGGEFQAGKEDTSGLAIELQVVGGKADDTIRLQGSTVAGAVGNTDKIDGGEGNNKVVILGSTTITAAGTAAAPVANVTNVQALEVRTGHDNGAGDDNGDSVTVDANAFDKLATVFVRNEGQTLPNLSTRWNSAAEAATVTLNNLTDAQAKAITVAHGTTGNNGLAQLTVAANLKTSTATETVAVEIVDGVNTNARFNFKLKTNNDVASTTAIERVENITLTDKDTESNTVLLENFADHVGTITLSGGRTGDYFSLDVETAADNDNGLARRATNGTTTDGEVIFGSVANNNAKYQTGWDDIGAANAVRLVAEKVDASQQLGNVTVRVSTTAANTDGGQTITMGAGDDIVIFDDINVASATRGSAGLTNADKVAGGAGKDTLVLDGDGANVVVQQSEWDNVSGFETVYLAGNGGSNKYFLQLDNDMIAANGTGGNLIAIDNDDDSRVNTKESEFADSDALKGTNVDTDVNNTAVRIDATTLSANMHFSYDGEEGTGATVDRFVVNDQNTNGGNIIDGGDVDVSVAVDANGVTRQTDTVRSNDVLEVRNTATVTTADLANVKNVGNLVINNDQATLQTLNLTLNSAVVDALSDAGHTASLTKTESLVIRANDGQMTDAAGTAVSPTAGAALNVNARDVSGAFGLTITGDSGFNVADTVDFTVQYGGGKHTIDLNGGTDTITLRGLAQTSATVRGTEYTFSNGTATVTHDIQDTEVLVAFNNAATPAEIGLTLTGSDIDDTIVGTRKADNITGGNGADTFVFADTAANNGADTLADLAVGVNNDVLNFSAFAIDGNATATAPASLSAVLTANPGTAANVSGTIARLVNIDDNQDITTAAGLTAAVAAGGEYANIDMAANSKAIIITSATAGADADYIFYATSDAAGVITATLVGTTNNVAIGDYAVGNFLI